MHTYIKKDKGRIYLRPTAEQRRRGKKQIRLFAEQGTEAFKNELELAQRIMEAAEPKPRLPHSLDWLIMSYLKSPEFTQLGVSTKRVRQRLLADIQLVHGQTPFTDVKTADIRGMRDQLANTPEAANARIKALRQVYRYANDCELTEVNPARNVQYLQSQNPDGFHTWTENEVIQFESRHPIGSKARLSMGLLLYTGVRRSDVVLLGPPMENRGNLVFTEFKNRLRKPKKRLIPVLPELRGILNASETGPFTYLITKFKRPYTANGFGNFFKRKCIEAGIPHCSAHGLRKCGAVRAAHAGATTRQLMAIFGWDSAKQAELYTQHAERDRMALENMYLLTK